jgi:hypothetical protein
MKAMSSRVFFGRTAGLGLLVVWLGLAAGPAQGAPHAKADKTPFATMAEVLAALGKPDTIVYAERRRWTWANDGRGMIALQYSKPRKRKFLISTSGQVLTGVDYITLPAQAIDPALSARVPQESVADVCRRYGNPDTVWTVFKDWLPRTPLAVQLTFEKAKMRYQFDSDGYALVGFAISDDLAGWHGKNIAEVFHTFGKPDLLTHPDNYSTKFEEGTPNSEVVMIYRRLRDRRWYVLADGTVFAIIESKQESGGVVTPAWDKPKPHHEESIAEWVNRRGRPDRIETITLPGKRGTSIDVVIALTYRGIHQAVCFSDEGYLLDDHGKCPPVQAASRPRTVE